jgi:ubiquinone/menaquinone biosynthesis C-methylase UbiE
MENPATAAAHPDPALVWDTMNAYQRTAALKAAIELDLFTAIAEGAHTPNALAARCHASSRGLRILCDYLTIIGFLSKDSGEYSLTPTSAAFLDRRLPGCMASIVRFINSPKLMSCFSNLTDAVRRGGTVQPQGGVTEEEFDDWVTFAESMAPLMGPASEFIADIACRDGYQPHRVLDIAAGHGLFGIAVGRKATHAEIVAQDWPNVLPVAQANARNAGIGDRYRLLPGDAFTVDYGAAYDVALVTNFLHHFDEPTCESLLKKLRAALDPGGRVITLEFVPNSDRVTPPIPASFSLMMLGATPNGDAYTMEQFDRMFRSAGFNRNELLQVPNSPEQLIVSTT